MEISRVGYEDLTPFEKSAVDAALFAQGVDACIELQAFLDACDDADEVDLSMLYEAYIVDKLSTAEDYH